MFSLKNRAVLAHFLSPAQRKSWGGKLWRGINRPSGRLSSRTSVRIFRFRNTWQKPMGDLFHIAHTHPLGGIDVHFGGPLAYFLTYIYRPSSIILIFCETQWCHSVKTRLYNKFPPYFIVLVSSVKTNDVEVIEFHRIADNGQTVPDS